ncbi:hypothetical protein HKL94_02645 [Candidatus Parcubacteria bacterium]|nr:hypothetical protein [Candidatus Parcubacteria bacterium]
MRTLNDIIPPSRRKEAGPSAENQGPLNFAVKRRAKFPYLTIIITALVIIISLGTLVYFSKAEVDVTPNSLTATIQNSFTASQSGGDLPFQIITAQKIASQSVSGSGTKTVNSTASGMITIYNTQTKAQTLIANTRFATASGLIFRIHSAVTIPRGTITAPGSVTREVYADKTGSTYNVGPTSFTIPGFAGTPQESMVYARSQNPMTGGASGVVPVVNSTLETQTRSALQTALAPDLLASIQAQVPSGYVLLPGASATSYIPLDSTPSTVTGQVNVREQGTITAVVFPNEALAKAIASSISGLNYQGEPLTLTSANNLLFSTVSMPSPGADSFSFTIAGTAPLTYVVDSNRIAAAVAGKTRSAAEVAISNYPEVKRAIIILRPFWRQTFPQDPSAISVVAVKP